ncbi:MAG: O-antigen ligase family protein [Desulfarculaceae bacterium]|nr:O-antigen ligase family protein [Desulfarculaceae bacterium]
MPWICLAYSPEKSLGLDYAMKSKYWIFTFIVAGMSLRSGRVHIMIKAFICGVFINAIVALSQYTELLPMVKEGHPGLGVVHTAASVYLVIGLIMSGMYFGREQRIVWKTCWILVMGFLLFHLAIMNGRAGYLSFILAAPLIANFMMKEFSVFKKGVVCFVLILVVFLSSTVQNRIENTIEDIEHNMEKIAKGNWFENSIKELPRFYIYDSAVRLMIKHPLKGLGTGGLKKYTARKGHAVVHPHNNILYMGVSFGIAGVIVCLWMFWIMLKTSWKYRHTQIGCFVLGIALVMFISGMFDTLIINSGTSILFSLGYGFLNHLEKLECTHG